MEEMNTVNVEEIMAQIRKEIAEKGYTSDMLSFQDAKTVAEPETAAYDGGEYRVIVDGLNRCAYIPWYRDLGQGGIKGFMKKVIRKLNVFLIAPMSDEQNLFNARTVQAVNQITRYMDEQKACIEAYKKEVEELQRRLEVVEDELENRKG